MWLAIAILTVVWLAIIGWACCAAAGNADDVMMLEYERQKAEFERMFE